MAKQRLIFQEVVDNEHLIRTPKDLESYVQYVYSSLLNLKNEGVVVSTNATLVGRSGAKHEIDVFYQFERSGITHKVAFECKYQSRSVEKADIVEFHGKIQDIGNIQGLFVSKSGYQKGAKEYGDHYGIRLLGLKDLPTLNILLSKRIQSVALPDETYIGEPFWTIMEIKDGELTGNYFAQNDGRFLKKSIIPLFISKNDANEFLSKTNKNEEFVVRGIPQHTLGFLLGTSKIGRCSVKFSLMLYGPDENDMWPGLVVDAEEIEDRFVLSDNFRGKS